MTVDNLSVYLENFLNDYGLEALEQYGIVVNQDGDLYNLKYNSNFEHKEVNIVRACRGAVVTNVNGLWKVVAYAFDRFFNYGEVETDFDFSNLQVQEKADGSLIKVFWYDNRWVVSTSGTPTGKATVDDSDVTWTELFWKTFTDCGYVRDDLNTNYCYVFELCTKLNRIVVNYNHDCVWLLTIRDCKNHFNEVDISSRFIKPCRWYSDNINEVLNKVKNLKGAESEGFVLVDGNKNRLKIKSEDYVLLHKARGNGKVSFAELLKADNVSEFVTYFPEYKERFDYYEKYIFILNVQCHQFIDVRQHLDQKEFALEAINSFLPSDALFSIRRGKYKKFADWLVDQSVKKIREVLNCD